MVGRLLCRRIAPAPSCALICHNNHSSERGYPYISLSLCCHNITHITMAYEMDQKVLLLSGETSTDFNEVAEKRLSYYFRTGWHIAQINGVNYLSKDYPVMFYSTPMFALFVLLERPKDYLKNHHR